MTTPSKTQQALNLIEKKPGIRTKELGEALGIPTENVLPLLVSAIRRRFVLTCEVTGANSRKTLEWRLSCAVSASDWDDFKAKNPDPGGKISSLSADRLPPTRRETQTPPSMAKAKLHVENKPDCQTQPRTMATAVKAWMEVETALWDAGIVKKGDAIEPGILRLIQEAQDLRQRIEQLEAKPSTDDGVDVKAVAVGYIVRTPKQKPRICAKPERAVEAAKSAARNHGRSDVLALVPVGTARSSRSIHVHYIDYAEA